MKITQTTVTKLALTEVHNLDPITVILEDFGPGQGKIIIECYGESWSAYWGGMGNSSIAQFVRDCDQHYIAGKLSNVRSEVFDPDGLVNVLKREIIGERRKLLIGSDEARKRFDRVCDLSLPTTENELWHLSTDMQELLGDEWWHHLPQKTNPDYAYLCRIVSAVKDAIRTLLGPALAAA